MPPAECVHIIHCILHFALGPQQESWERIEAEELQTLESITVREVLEVEMQDARHRKLKHRERVRWLEAELDLAEKRAAMWKGATPSSEADRIQAMERELAYLELAGRLRTRLNEQRLALELTSRREKVLLDRLFSTRARTASS